MRLFHFSEDPSIQVFVPHVAATAVQRDARVWAVDEAHAASYWFPRQCPRACCWLRAGQDLDHAPDLIGHGVRMHAIQRDWEARMRACVLYRYLLPSDRFVLDDPEGGFWIAREPVRPLEVRAVGDLYALHREAGIELRIVPDLRPLIDAIVASGLGFSIIRARNL